MASFFGYDKRPHRISAIDCYNEDQKLLGYRPFVRRINSNGSAQELSDIYPELNNIFESEKLAIDFACDFLVSLGNSPS